VSGGGAPRRGIPRDEPVLFASDIHLDAAAPRTTERFLAALERDGPASAHLFLLGDVFEMWVGDDGADAVAARLRDTLGRLAARGTRVWLMRGNRDFLLDVPLPGSSGPPWTAGCGATLLDDPTPLDLHGVPALLTHGDALCTGDTVYQQWRRTCRDPAWQQAMLARPLAQRIAIGRAARDDSEAGKREKPGALMDVDQAAVDAAMDAAGASLLIHGHTHRPAIHRWQHVGLPRTRVVLTDWDAEADRGTLLAWRRGEPSTLV
jgi:UDP-2,3-diacylglucosamine hydrolase